MSSKLTYGGTGVRYDAMDPFKLMAQDAARETAGNIAHLGIREVPWSRGESVYLTEMQDCYLAHVEEGLGTKIIVADDMYDLTGRCFYHAIAQDTVAMIVNDMITLGALPISVAMHLAVGSSDWFSDEERCRDLVEGWKHACALSSCVWGGGETPTLKDIVGAKEAVLAGSAMGIVRPKSRVIRGNIRSDDDIVIIGSSGIHANGLTLARQIAADLPEGYLTKLPDGRTFGETLLDPTRIYVPLIEHCLLEDTELHYAVNITGHGWRKLMRATQPFAYVIERLPRQLPVFAFMQEQGPIDDREAYGNLNMGAGFALYVPETDTDKILRIAKRLGLEAYRAGYIEKSASKKVVIEPKELEYLGSTLTVR